MKKIAVLLSIAVIAAVALAAEKVWDLPIAKLTLRVIDEHGNPVPDASVKMGFQPSYLGGSREPIVYVNGVTNADGRFTGEGHSNDRQGGLIQKSGYYSSSPESYKFEKVVDGKWQPWNPTFNVLLKKIVNPIPMYARRLQVQMPESTQPVGFDLAVGDWVAPYGKGATGDILFTLKRRFVDRRNYEASVSVLFPYKGDGLQIISEEDVNSGSELKLPRTAPEDGYDPKLTTSIGAAADGPEHEDAQANRSYFLRVRTVLDGDEKVKSALYGKIDGDFRLDAINSKTSIVLFTYYLNPTPNDRNMEFDPKRNLLGDLPFNERVTNP